MIQIVINSILNTESTKPISLNDIENTILKLFYIALNFHSICKSLKTKMEENMYSVIVFVVNKHVVTMLVKQNRRRFQYNKFGKAPIFKMIILKFSKCCMLPMHELLINYAKLTCTTKNNLIALFIRLQRLNCSLI